ncbi:hypothetical protein T4B_4548 [Trichinella pseudospiralis]|uniref:Uncharacterized protein n=1 Tax=Trichinella pseudospiralis TaxID=6337 RepID=A0A0V1EGH1_TRIPS|nr:hypothetical protein T4A_5163 [Trichinella pseudospiralis]KRZ22982.1 hypothetical protein T4B_4548 [Trichinella pseudospiralis]KRZ24479.1 hypothetical protein T4C_5732 [Trichinella pseudospiralis]
MLTSFTNSSHVSVKGVSGYILSPKKSLYIAVLVVQFHSEELFRNALLEDNSKTPESKQASLHLQTLVKFSSGSTEALNAAAVLKILREFTELQIIHPKPSARELDYRAFHC